MRMAYRSLHLPKNEQMLKADKANQRHQAVKDNDHFEWWKHPPQR
jgi:hypothetical protein